MTKMFYQKQLDYVIWVQEWSIVEVIVPKHVREETNYDVYSMFVMWPCSKAHKLHLKLNGLWFFSLSSKNYEESGYGLNLEWPTLTLWFMSYEKWASWKK